MATQFHVCDCNSHAWARLTRAYVVLCDAEAAEYMSTRHWHVTGGKTPSVVASATLYDGPQRARYYYSMAQMVCPVPSTYVVDHINRNRMDNRSSNLRAASHSLNAHNRRTVSSSGFRGVSFYRNMYRALITIKGQQIYLGKYKTAEDAARVYDAAAVRLLGSCASLNFERSA